MAPSEPDENISGDTPIAEARDSTNGASTRAAAIIDRLGDRYWRKRYGDKPAFDCAVRTVLSQHTSDAASQPAFDALIDRFGTGDDLATALRDSPTEIVAETIKEAGLYNQKARVLATFAETVLDRWGSTTAFDRYVREEEYEAVRTTLLSVDGIGPKTADCVLLFSGGRDGVFPVDTHVYRIARRLGIAPPDADHETVRRHLEEDVPAHACGFGHTAMIQFGREYCTATGPACLAGDDACPLSDLCDQVGVDPETNTVEDPADE